MHHLSRTALAGVLLVACASAHAQSGATLAQAFSNDMIGARISYFESLAGVARSVSADVHHYRVEGCDITAHTRDAVVSSLRLQLSPECGVNLAHDLGRFAPAASQPLTIGSFVRSTEGALDYYVDCLSRCDKASGPAFYAYWQGPDEVGFLEVMLEVALESPAALDASARLSADMQKAYGEGRVTGTQFNCDPSFHEQAAQHFDQVAVTALTIGTELHTPGCD